MSPIAISPQRRDEILDALRRGTVPASSLDLLAVGLGRFEATLRAELDAVRTGRGVFKAVRGEYGSGKTFFARWFEELARRDGFATSEVQISETETPLHRLESVYRRVIEQLATIECRPSALRSVIDGWFFTLEEEVMADGVVPASDGHGLLDRANALMEERLAAVTRTAPTFAACLRRYRQALASGDREIADGFIARLAGSPNVSARIKRSEGIRGEVDHFGALSFLQGLLTVLRDSGSPGRVLVLDEEEAGVLAMGQAGEGEFGYRNFMELVSVFSSPPLVSVFYGRSEIGQVHELTFQGRNEAPTVLTLAGRGWVVNHIDWARRRAYVGPTDIAGRSLWVGTAQPMHLMLSQAVAEVLGGAELAINFSKRAHAQLQEARAEHSWVERGTTVLIHRRSGVIEWWKSAGHTFNTTMAEYCRRLGLEASGNPFSVTVWGTPTSERFDLPYSNRPLRRLRPWKCLFRRMFCRSLSSQHVPLTIC